MKIKNLNRLKQKIARMPDEARKEIRAAMAVSAGEIVETAKAFAPVKSGDLRNSIGYTFGEYRPDNANVRGVSAKGGKHDLSVTIHAGDQKAWYAALVEFGTAPHVIRPRERGGFLSFLGLSVAAVRHPGAEPHPFFNPAVRLGRKRAMNRIGRAVSKAARNVAASK